MSAPVFDHEAEVTLLLALRGLPEQRQEPRSSVSGRRLVEAADDVTAASGGRRPR